MAHYFDKIQYLYPNIPQVVYWHTKYDGTPWDDPYDGIIWDNTDIRKPTKEELDAITDLEVETELNNRFDAERKAMRDNDAKTNLGLIGQFQTAKQNNAALTLTQFLDDLEAFAEGL